VTSIGGSDVFIAKFKNSGSLTWIRTYGSSETDISTDVCIGVDGKIAMVGYYNGTSITFGTKQITSKGLRDGFIVQFSTYGTVQSAVTLGGTSNDYCQSCFYNYNASTLYVAGSYNGNYINQIVVPNVGQFDMFVTGVDVYGRIQYLEVAGGTSDDSARALAVSHSDSIYTAGRFSNTISFGTLSLTSAGLVDTFVTKLSDTGTVPVYAYRKNVGGPKYTDSKGNVWLADNVADSTGSLGSTALAISSTNDQPIYQTYKWLATVDQVFTTTVPNGIYNVRLHYADIYSGTWGNNKRVFDVYLNSVAFITKLDIYKEVGGDTALIKTSLVNVTTGSVVITHKHVIENPLLSGFEIVSVAPAQPAIVAPDPESSPLPVESTGVDIPVESTYYPTMEHSLFESTQTFSSQHAYQSSIAVQESSGIYKSDFPSSDATSSGAVYQTSIPSVESSYTISSSETIMSTMTYSSPFVQETSSTSSEKSSLESSVHNSVFEAVSSAEKSTRNYPSPVFSSSASVESTQISSNNVASVESTQLPSSDNNIETTFTLSSQEDSSFPEISSGMPSESLVSEISSLFESPTVNVQSTFIESSYQPEASIPEQFYSVKINSKSLYSACEQPVINAQVVTSSGTQSTNLKWTVIGLQNQNFDSKEIVQLQSSEFTMDLNSFARGRSYNITAQLVSESFIHAQDSVIVTFDDFSYNVTAVYPQKLEYKRSDTLSLNASISKSSCAPEVSGRWFVNTTISNNQLLNQSTVDFNLKNLLVQDNYYLFDFRTEFNLSQLIGTAYNHRKPIVLNSQIPVIHVAVSNPVAIISGKQSRTTSINVPMSFDGKNSYDAETNGTSCSSYYWTCSPQSMCLNQSSVSQVDSSFKFTSNGTFTVTLRCGVDSRFGYANASVVVYSAPVPDVTIASGTPATISRRNKLSVSVDVYPVEYDKMDFLWKLTQLNPDTIVPLNSTNLKSPTATGKNLIIREDSLESGNSYRIAVYVKFKSEQVFIASDSIVFKTSSAPRGGVISVLPPNGTTLVTKFSVTTSDWIVEPDEYPLVYILEYYNQAKAAFIPLRMASSISSLVTYLPPGFSGRRRRVQDDTDLQLYISVQNVYGDSARIPYSVQVQPLSAADMLVAVSNALANLNNQDPETILNDLPTIVETASTGTQLDSDSQTKFLQFLSKTGVPTSEAAVNSQVALLESITSSDAEMTEEAQEIALNMIGNILTSPNAVTIVSRDATDSIVTVVSNVARSSLSTKSSEEMSQKTVLIVSSVGTLSFKKLAVGEEPDTFTSKNIDMMFQSNTASDLQDLQIKEQTQSRRLLASDDALVTIPPLDILANNTDPLYVEFVKFKNGMNPYAYSASSANLTSAVLNFRLLQSSGSQFVKLPLHDLENPLVFKLQKKNLSKKNNVYSCRSWDESNSTQTEWNTNGCILAGETDDYVVCNCTHTTSFAAFEQFTASSDTTSPLKRGVFIFSIIYYCIIGILTIVTMVTVIIFRNAQPIRSRHIVPYIGLTAILAEVIIQGITRNSMLLGLDVKTHWKQLNGISYAVVCIVSPLGLMALSVYLWQMLRYIFMKRMMNLMIYGSEVNVLRMFRLLTSKLVFIGIVCTVGIVSALYFVILSIIGGSSAMNPLDNSILQSVSYWILEIVIAACIIGVFVFDLSVVQFTEFKKKQIMETAQQDSSGVFTIQKSKSSSPYSFMHWMRVHFISNDPLLFRMESVFMVLSIVALVVAFILGLIENFSFINLGQEFDTPLVVGRVIFDVIYISLRLLVFGGFTSIVCIRNKLRMMKSVTIVEQASQTRSPEEQYGILEHLMRSQHGLQVFKEYCVKEMSLENVLLWKELDIITPAIMTPQERHDLMQKLNTNYIARNSPYEVNIDGETRKQWNLLLKKQSHEDEDLEKYLKVIKKVSLSVMNNCGDTFSRFSDTVEYKAYLRNVEMESQLQTFGFSDV
jgi:hypothetical protein